jgi:solute carrier family 25 folate transporter 32
VLGYLPTWAIYFAAYNNLKTLYASGLGEFKLNKPKFLYPYCSCIDMSVNDPLVHVNAAMSAGAISTIATNPFWVVKTRFMVTSGRKFAIRCLYVAKTQSDTSAYKYNSTWHAFRVITAGEGVRGLYRGLVPSLFGALHVALQFPIYEKLKISLRKLGTRLNCKRLTSL